VDIYEVHEGWVHVGTTLNGRSQPVCEFLSIGPPRCAATQEGLAVIMEIFTFRSFIAIRYDSHGVIRSFRIA
jgi:hypothetical protein